MQILPNPGLQNLFTKNRFQQEIPSTNHLWIPRIRRMGRKKIFNIMAINQIKLFTGHVRNNDDTGKLLCSELEYVQLISGVEYPILNKSTNDNFLKWTLSCWITNFKLILKHLEGETKLDNQWHPSLQRNKTSFS